MNETILTSVYRFLLVLVGHWADLSVDKQRTYSPLYMLVMILIITGIRIEDALHLTRSQISDNGVLTVTSIKTGQTTSHQLPPILKHIIANCSIHPNARLVSMSYAKIIGLLERFENDVVSNYYKYVERGTESLQDHEICHLAWRDLRRYNMLSDRVGMPNPSVVISRLTAKSTGGDSP